MIIFDYASLVEDDNYLVCVGKGIWLMDDHRWALKVWEFERSQSTYTLFHADYHWDCCDDFHDHPDDEAQLIAASPEQVADIVAKGDLTKYDSFIAPAIKRKLINTIHFYCLQGDSGDSGFDVDFLEDCGATQVVHQDIQSFAGVQLSGPVIFDLCLDLFNRSDNWAEGDLWSDIEILDFMAKVRPLIIQAELVTVSLSFNYSGTEADTRHLAKLIVPLIMGFRE